jgi:diguanylate cyclase (GGDEF)-like protein
LGGYGRMALDVGTLLTVLLIVCAVLTALLALTWAQSRSVPAFGIWTICFGLCTLAAGLLAARDRLPGLLAIDIANALRFAAFGLAWHAVRRLGGKQGSWFVALMPAATWVAALAFLMLDGAGIKTRILASAPVMVGYALGLTFELWRAAPRFRWIARPAAIVLGVHAAIFALRFVMALFGSDSFLVETAIVTGPLSPFAILEMLVVAIAIAFLLLSAAKEEVGMRHRQAALIDPLTGVGNRRGFDSEVERIFADAMRKDGPMALILFDLDHFKEINDNFGHPAGDRILRTLTRTVAAHLRPDDVLGRLGGDEFGILLADTRIEQAQILAERVRRAVAAMVVRTDPTVRFTVSIGVAGLRQGESPDILFERADAALYRAKACGRNRVESALGRRLPSGPRAPRAEETMQRVA